MSLNSAVAVSPNRGLVAIYAKPKDGSSKRLIIKCYDSKVSIGTLKFTLSANMKDESDGENSGATVNKLHFATNECLLASLSNNKILVFDLNRGIHSQTIDVNSNSNGDLYAFTGKDNLIYALIKKDGKTVTFVYDMQKKGKVVKKIKCGSCDDDDRLGMAIHPKEDVIAICIGKKIKFIDVSTGASAGKCKIKSNEESKVTPGEEGGVNDCILQFSSDGMIIGVTMPNSVHLFDTKTGGRIGMVNATDTTTTAISSIHIHSGNDDKKYVATVVSSTASKASLVEINPSTSKKNTAIQPLSTITLPTNNDDDNDNNSKIINEVFFSPGKQGGSNIMLVELKPRGMNNVDVSMTQVSYKNEGTDEFNLGELYPSPVGSGDGKSGADLNTTSSKKRKVSSTTSIVLGPGESGGEAMIVTDQNAAKRIKTESDDDDDDDGDDFALEEGDEAEESIAQKLALLSSELDRDTEDEEDLLKIQSSSTSNKFIIKGATSDSLAILLRQSLTSNDDAQLEVALQVSDKRVIENSILGLATTKSTSDNEDSGSAADESEIVIMLLTKLVTRLSRKPARAQRLAFWIRTVLVALISKIGSSNDGTQMGRAEKEIASRLGPLRNMLSERVESLPELLRLEGRLSLLSSQL